MNLDEHEGKTLLEKIGLPIPRGERVTSPAGAANVAQEIHGPVMVKALVMAGKRGLGGGVSGAENPAEAAALAARLLGSVLNGHEVKALRVEERIPISQELYLSITLDRTRGQLVSVIGRHGGMAVEGESSDSFTVTPLPCREPYSIDQALKPVSQVGLNGRSQHEVAQFLTNLHYGVRQFDLLLAEINPLFLLPSGGIIAGDAKMIVDDDALFRQGTNLAAVLSNQDREKPGDVEIRMVKLDGDIGVLAGGAGLCLATMDAITRAGGRPANFLDVGGGVTQAQMVEWLQRVDGLGVKGILINVFGGINNCETIAQGVIEAVEKLNLRQPIVVRMQGHYEEQGWALLEETDIEVVKRASTRQAAARLVGRVSGPA